jgi:hypothetical protein
MREGLGNRWVNESGFRQRRDEEKFYIMQIWFTGDWASAKQGRMKEVYSNEELNERGSAGMN